MLAQRAKGRCDRPCAKQGSPNPPPAIPSGIMSVMPGPALPALVCHNPTRKRLRHSHDPGTSRTLRRKYDDVHPRTQPRGPLRAQPSGLRRAPESTLPIVATTQRHTRHYRYRLSALPASIIVLCGQGRDNGMRHHLMMASGSITSEPSA